MRPLASRPLRPVLLALLTTVSALLTGCDYLGIEKPMAETERKVAEGKAIGGACRHANRALEDCYRYNPKAVKAAIFDGWKDMDVYMRENKLDTIAPVTPPELPKPKAPPKAEGEASDEHADDDKAAPAKGAEKNADKGGDKKATAKH